MSRKKKKNGKHTFELWRDRAFSVLVPIFLAYVLITQQHHDEIKIIVIILLAGFATGQAATFIKHIASGIGSGIIKAADENRKKNNENENGKNNNTKSS